MYLVVGLIAHNIVQQVLNKSKQVGFGPKQLAPSRDHQCIRHSPL